MISFHSFVRIESNKSLDTFKRKNIHLKRFGFGRDQGILFRLRRYLNDLTSRVPFIDSETVILVITLVFGCLAVIRY